MLLVDARAWTREALAQALEDANPDMRVLRFGNVADLAQLDPGIGAALVLLNLTGIGLGDRRVAAALATVESCVPGQPVVALSDSQDAEEIVAAIERGLSGYIPLSLDLHLVVEALRFVAAGGIYVPAELFLAGVDVTPRPESPSETAAGSAAAAVAVNGLTTRERAVLNILHQGKSNKEIARDLDLREATVKVHVRHIMRKLGVVNRTQVVLLTHGVYEPT